MAPVDKRLITYLQYVTIKVAVCLCKNINKKMHRLIKQSEYFSPGICCGLLILLFSYLINIFRMSSQNVSQVKRDPARQKNKQTKKLFFITLSVTDSNFNL